MKTLEIDGGTGRSTLYVGERLRNVKDYIPDTPVVILTDAAVRQYYGHLFPSAEVIEIGQGEGIKTLDTVQSIYRRLVELEADRSVFILGIGGGIVCDVAGFVASTYLRGVRFGFAATTLLAQVDASVGGKNGVNFAGYKNMVGVFNQPEWVVCDMELLKTLPKREVLSGFAEIIKHGAIGDADLFGFLESRADRALGLDLEVIERLVYDSVVIKASIVNRDERERGGRRKLNFGHTFGHAVEKVTRIPHGEAVSIGMAVAARLSVQKGLLSQDRAGRIPALIDRYGLPSRLEVNPGDAIDALRRDKKREGDRINFVLLRDIGEAVVREIPLTELEAVVYELCEH